MTKPAPLPECPRTPVDDVHPADPAASLTTAHLRDAARLVAAAYPRTALSYDQDHDQTYILEAGQAYSAELHFDRDAASGYAALVLTYPSRDEAALRGGREMSGGRCRSGAELVVARWANDDQPAILSRAPLDDEALAVDVRTLAMRDDFEGARVQLLYFAYYAAAGWMGHVGFRSDVAIRGTKLIASRLPASYLKRSLHGPQRLEGALGPAGASPGVLRLMVARLDTTGEVYEQIEVPTTDEAWLSGAEILRRIPGGTDAEAGSAESPGAPVDAGPQSLLGSWRKERIVGADDSLEMDMDFISDTEMDYCVQVGGQWIVHRMAHRIEGDTLVFKPSPASADERWRLRFESADAMVLENEDSRVWLRRGRRRAP